MKHVFGFQSLENGIVSYTLNGGKKVYKRKLINGTFSHHKIILAVEDNDIVFISTTRNDVEIGDEVVSAADNDEYQEVKTKPIHADLDSAVENLFDLPEMTTDRIFEFIRFRGCFDLPMKDEVKAEYKQWLKDESCA